MAQAMDSFFVNFAGAKRKGDDAPALLARSLESGRDEGRNLRWLADRIAGLYRFWRE